MSPEIERAAATIREGGIVAHATEGVWGFACDPNNPAAIERILAIKARPQAKGLLLIADKAQAFAPELEQCADAEAVMDSWPGAHTWVLPNTRFSAWVTGSHHGVACRVPGHAQARNLCAAVGSPLVSTSANRGGEPAITQYREVQAQFQQEVDFILPGEVVKPGQASTIHGLDGEVLRA